MNLKIQILAGNTLMSRFHVGFEIELPLVLKFPQIVTTAIFVFKQSISAHFSSLQKSALCEVDILK